MKKILGFIALVVLVVLPLKANAATWGLTFDGTEADEQGYFTVTVKGIQSDNPSGMQEINTTMTMTNVEYVSDTGSGKWTVSRNGNALTFINEAPVYDAEFTVATLTFKKVDLAAECDVVFNCNNENKKVTPKTKTVKNPKTGSALPYAVIATGIVLATGVYYVTRRNTKLYKI